MNTAKPVRHAELPANQAERFLLLDALTPFLTDTQLLAPMRKLGLVPATDKWTQSEVARIRRGFKTSRQQFYRQGQLHPELWHELAMQAGQDREIAKAVQEATKRLPFGSQNRQIPQQVMLSLYSDLPLPDDLDDAQVVNVVGHILDAQSFTLDWFLKRSQPIRDHVFRAMLEDLFHTCRIWPTATLLMDAFEQERYQPERVNIFLHFAQLFRGRTPEAKQLENFRSVDVMTLIGLDQLLHEDYATALDTQLEARKVLRKEMGRRTAELPILGSLVLQTARLGTGQDLITMHRECQMLFRDFTRQGVGFLALLDMLAARMIGEPEMSDRTRKDWITWNFDQSDLFSRLLYAHACTLHDDRTWLDPCIKLRDELVPLLPVAAAILDDALAAAGKKRSNLNLPHPDFRRFILNTPAWEQQLEALSTLLTDQEQQKQVKKDKPKRLVWILDTLGYTAYPKVQTCNAKGVWTAGQRFAAKRLMVSNEEDLDWLTPHDRKMGTAYSRYDYYNGHSWEFAPERGLPLLAGHPLIFEERTGAHISLEQRPVELIVTEKPDGCEVRLSASSEGYKRLSLQKVGENTWAVLVFDQTTEAVSRLLAKGQKDNADKAGERAFMPKEALPRLLDLTQRSRVPVRLELKAEERPGESLPVVQLRPQGAGFAADLWVRPLGSADSVASDGANVVFRTGQGQAHPTVVVAGRPLRLIRDFAREQAEAERLLTACPTLGATIEEGRWYTDDLEEFLQVLTELKEAGPLCRVEWPEGEKLRLAGMVSPEQLRIRTQKGSAGDWFTLSGEVRIDEEHTLALSELLDRLAAGRGRFVELASGEFLALTEEARRCLRRLQFLTAERRAGKGKKGDLVLHPLAGPAVDEACAGMDFERDDTWKAALKRMSEALSLTPETPKTLQAELRPYQREGFVWLARLANWGVGGCLADDMGLGKTVQSIAAMLCEAPKGPCLVIAPTSVCPNWEAELARFAPSLAVRRLRDVASGDRADVVREMRPGMVLIAGYGLLSVAGETLAVQHWRMVIFDEAQPLKNDLAKRTQAAAKIPADFRLALTGTPIENHLDDLWSLFNIINPGLLGATHPEFHRRFADASQGGQRATALKLLIRPFILRRLKSQVLDDLPSRTEQTLLIEPDETEQSFYEALRRRAVESLKVQQEMGGRRRINILAELMRLRRACCHASLVEAGLAGEMAEESSKMRCFLDLLEEAREGGHRLLVFSQFVGFLTLVRAMLDKRKISYQYLDGSTPEDARRERVAAFQAGLGDAFLISLKAGGQGLNLTAADYVVHLDPWWNPAVEDQATDRAHRIGQERPVTVYRLVMAHSVEEKILALHARKRELAADFLEGTDAAVSASTLSEEELLALMQ